MAAIAGRRSLGEQIETVIEALQDLSGGEVVCNDARVIASYLGTDERAIARSGLGHG